MRNTLCWGPSKPPLPPFPMGLDWLALIGCIKHTSDFLIIFHWVKEGCSSADTRTFVSLKGSSELQITTLMWLWCFYRMCNTHCHGLYYAACEAQSRSLPPCGLTLVHRCHMSVLCGREGLPEQALCRSQGNCFGILNETPPIFGDLWVCLWLSVDSEFGVCGRSTGPQGKQQIGANPWSLRPKLISHTVPSVLVTCFKDWSFLASSDRFPA